MYGWLNEGKFLINNGRTCSLTDPKIVEALQYMTDTYDAIKGAENVSAFEISAQMEGMGDPFLAGRMVMVINGDWFLDYIVRLQT